MTLLASDLPDYYCVKHGSVVIKKGTVESLNLCPRCAEVRDSGLCTDCEKHKAKVVFANGAMDYIHGVAENLCKCCYFNRVVKVYADTKENYEKLKAELEAAPCS